jgi:acyl-CoA dehydrogenase
MSDEHDEIADAVDDVLRAWGPAEHAQPATALAAWNGLLELGFPYVSIDESLGGSGEGVQEAFAVLRALGRHGSSAPVAESGFLAGWLLAGAGLEIHHGLTALVPPTASGLRFDGSRVTGSAEGVAWAREADAVVALVDGPDGPVVVELPAGEVEVESERATVAGEPRSTIRVAAAPSRWGAAGTDRDGLLRRAAASRVALIAGGLERARDLTVRYTHERVQFGQPVASFQAVQVHLARLAEDAQLVGGAADLLGAALDATPDPAFEVASASLVARSSARESAKAAHQAHGAMGVTREYPLHVVTRHLWQWSHEHGTAAFWRSVVLASISAAGADGYYPLITGGTDKEGDGR